MLNVTFEIFLVYHIRNMLTKILAGPLHVYSGVIEKDHLTIITAFILKDKYLYANLLCALS